MFGAYGSTNWAVRCVKNKVTFYLVEVDDSSCKVVWSRKRDKCKKFKAQTDALKCADQININHNKKLEVNVAQV